MKRFTMTVVLLGALAVPGWSQDSGDAPEQGVARISLLNGDVTVRRGDTGESVAAELNVPLVARDHVITESGSRVEIQFDWANSLRLAPDSEIRLTELRDGDFVIEIAEGTATFRVLRDSSANVELSTPTVSARPMEKGTYRVTVHDDGSTEVTVRSGVAELFSARGTERLNSGQTLLARGDASRPEFFTTAAIPRDEWDRWNESRDRDLERSDSYRYVSRDIYGAEDLDGHGVWVYDAPYGWVWVPRVEASWAPYRVGRWSWVDYYGWTWVSGDPWGWAPYHYGRWYQTARYGWAWYPGAVGPRYYWHPALVGFFGWGSGSVSVGFGFGNVGWVPLAPHEVYRPWYGSNRSRTVVVNNTIVVNNVNVYRNARGGVTSMHSSDFGRRTVTVNNFVRSTDRDLVRAGEVRGRMPLEPSRESRQYSERTITTRNTTRRNAEPQFVSRGNGRPVTTTVNRNETSRVAAPTETRRAPLAATAAEGRRTTPERRDNTVSAPAPRVVQSRGQAREAAAPITRDNTNVQTRSNNDRARSTRPESPPSFTARSRETAAEAPRRTAPEARQAPPPAQAAPNRSERPSVTREQPQPRPQARPAEPVQEERTVVAARSSEGRGEAKEAPKPQNQTLNRGARSRDRQ